MRAIYFSGLIVDGRTFVMRYKADPVVREIDAVQGTFNWGQQATGAERIILAEHLLRGMNAPSCLVQEFADEIIGKMREGQMWLLSSTDVLDWIEAKSIAA